MKPRCMFTAGALSVAAGVVLMAFVSCSSGDGTKAPTPTKQPPVFPEAKGYALAIGLNRVNPAYYDGWSGELTGCEPDASDMEEIEKSQGFNTTRLFTSSATRPAVLNELSSLAERMQKGDLLIVSYSGHGGQVPDQNNDEPDYLDETWCLYDGELIDDEIFSAWMKFREGVRILVLSDSCHSGTVTKMKNADFAGAAAPRMQELEKAWKVSRVPARLDRQAILKLPELRDAIKVRTDLRQAFGSRISRRDVSMGAPVAVSVRAEEEKILVSRALPPSVAIRTFQKNKGFYEKIGREAPKEDPSNVKAAIISISGCEDAQTSADLGFNGLFTWALKGIWDQGAFSGDHRKFHEAIKTRVLDRNPDQSPEYFTIGAGFENFSIQRPFTIQK